MTVYLGRSREVSLHREKSSIQGKFAFTGKSRAFMRQSRTHVNLGKACCDPIIPSDGGSLLVPHHDAGIFAQLLEHGIQKGWGCYAGRNADAQELSLQPFGHLTLPFRDLAAAHPGPPSTHMLLKHIVLCRFVMLNCAADLRLLVRVGSTVSRDPRPVPAPSCVAASVITYNNCNIVITIL